MNFYIGQGYVSQMNKNLDNTHLISSKDIENNNIQWGSVDNFKLIKNKAIIINTDLSKNQGIHWIVLCLLDDDDIYIIDSLGKHNKRTFDNIMYKRLYSHKIHFFPYSHQYKDNSLCGWHAITTAKYINKNRILTQELCYNVVKKLWGNSADDDDIKLIIEKFGKI